MTDEERFDEFLRGAAQHYHRPPETPREAMWARIEAARRARTEVRAPQRAERHWWRWVTGIAATLLLGVAIGRFTASPDATRAPTLAEARARDTAPGTSATVAANSNDSVGVTTEARATETSGVRFGVSRGPVAADTTGTRPEQKSAITSAPYQVAALQHLGRAEALLTSFRADTRAGRLDTQISGWARELLSTTRLLLDSPAARDARMGRLLADLELVLAQIAQLPAERGAGELELIEQAVEQRDVLFRLRATVPAGTVRAGT